MVDKRAARAWMKEFMGIDVALDDAGPSDAAPGGSGLLSEMMTDPFAAARGTLRAAATVIATKGQHVAAQLEGELKDPSTTIEELERRIVSDLSALENEQSYARSKAPSQHLEVDFQAAADRFERLLSGTYDLPSNRDHWAKSELESYHALGHALAVGMNHERFAKRHADIQKIEDPQQRLIALHQLDADIQNQLRTIPDQRRAERAAMERAVLAKLAVLDPDQVKQDIAEVDDRIGRYQDRLARTVRFAGMLSHPDTSKGMAILQKANHKIEEVDAIADPGERLTAKNDLAASFTQLFAFDLGLLPASTMSEADLLTSPDWLIRVHLALDFRWRAPFEPTPEALDRTHRRDAIGPTQRDVNKAAPAPGQDEAVIARLRSFPWFREGHPPFDDNTMNAIRAFFADRGVRPPQV